MNQQTNTIRELNDLFRSGDNNVPGQIMITSGVQALADEHAAGNLGQAYQAVRDYSDFNPDNDPHQEHDFGALDLWNQILFWKLDYYDPDLQHGSSDPADITKTVRVLTIMLASEY